MPLEPQRPPRPQRSLDYAGLRRRVHRKWALAGTLGAGIGNKRAEEAILEPGVYDEVPRPPYCTHPACACPRCPCQEWIPQRRCGIASGPAKAPLALGSSRSLGTSWFVFGMRRRRPKGAHQYLNWHARRAESADSGAYLALSANSLTNMPPTTERAWNPCFLPSVVEYQSVSGTRSGDSVTQR